LPATGCLPVTPVGTSCGARLRCTPQASADARTSGRTAALAVAEIGWQGVSCGRCPREAAVGGSHWRPSPLPDPRGGASAFAPGAAGRRPDRLPGRRSGRGPALGCGRWPVAVGRGRRHGEHLRRNRHPAGSARLATQVGDDQRSTELRIGAAAARKSARLHLRGAGAGGKVCRCSTVRGRFAWTVFLAIRGTGEWELGQNALIPERRGQSRVRN
jgi:hypothetical protein